MAVDDSYTVALLHFDGVDNDTTFTDESGKIWTAVGNAHIHTGEKKFGTASGYFDGAGDYLSTPDHADFDMGTGNFTIDFWFYDNGSPNSWPTIIANSFTGFGGQNCFGIRYNNTGQTGKFSVHGGTLGDPYLKTAYTYATTTWCHVAFVREATTVVKLYVNGKQGGNATIAAASTFDLSNSNSTKLCLIGWDIIDGAGGYIKGYIDELRISKGIARWTSDFTPKRNPYETQEQKCYLYTRRNRLNIKGVSTQNQLA